MATPDDRVPLDRLLAGDQDAWRDLLLELLPQALEHLRAGFKLPADKDRENPEGAFYSAWPSFQKHFLTEKELQDAEDVETLASHFLRITYNRSVRETRADEKLKEALWREARPFDATDSGTTGPAEVVAWRDFLAYFRKVVDEEVRALESQPRKYQILREWLAADMRITQMELARRVGETQSKVSRTLEEFRERMSRQLRGEGPD